MNVVFVDESNLDRVLAESSNAIKDFLYMLYDIVGDMFSTGDWARAELGNVDPFAYLDIAYDCQYQVRTDRELEFIHRAAALNLLCRLADIENLDFASGSTDLPDFRRLAECPSHEPNLRKYRPVLFQIREAFEAGRVVSQPSIQRAFKAALYGPEEFHDTLRAVTSEVVIPTFEVLFAP